MTSPVFTEAGISGRGGWARSSSPCVTCVCGAASACSSTAAGKEWGQERSFGSVRWPKGVGALGEMQRWAAPRQTVQWERVRFESCPAVSDKILKCVDELKPRALLRSARCQTARGSGVSTFSHLPLDGKYLVVHQTRKKLCCQSHASDVLSSKFYRLLLCWSFRLLGIFILKAA